MFPSNNRRRLLNGQEQQQHQQTEPLQDGMNHGEQQHRSSFCKNDDKQTTKIKCKTSARSGSVMTTRGGSSRTASARTCRSIHGWIQLLLLITMFLLILNMMVTKQPNHDDNNKHHDQQQQQEQLSQHKKTVKTTTITATTTTPNNQASTDQQPLVFHQIFAAARRQRRQQQQQERGGNHHRQRRSVNGEIVHKEGDKEEEEQVITLVEDGSHRYPVGNRPLFLSSESHCAIARQMQPWRVDLSTDISQRPSMVLQANPDCSDDSQSTLAAALARTTRTTAEITLALFYYQDMALLSRQLHSWTMWPLELRQAYQFVILDDGSPVGYRAMDLLYYHDHNHHHNDMNNNENTQPLHELLNLTIYEVEQDLPFNMGGVRNLAHVVAPTDFVLATDADVLLNATVASYLLTKVRQEQQHQQPQQPMRIIFKFLNQLMPDKTTFEPHPAVMLSTKEAYWAVGGCDEDLVGNYGQTDILLLWKADRDPTIHVESLLEEMQHYGLFVSKIWKPESRLCHALFSCPTPPNVTVVTRKTSSITTRMVRKRQKLPRILKYNMEIFAHKKRREAPFSNTFLRFRWHRLPYPV